jgi:hypothetical protein
VRAAAEETPMTKRFAADVLAEVARSRILGIRAGATHRIIGVWVVVVSRRIFVRSWSVDPDGWVHAFVEEPHGVMKIGDRKIPVRAIRTRSERLKSAVDRAYAAKYTTPASQKYVRGFRASKRRDATIELVPWTKSRRRP